MQTQNSQYTDQRLDRRRD